MVIKKDQHFVWQYYLKRWINNEGKVYALDLKENRLLNVKSKNICFQKFMYSIEGLTYIDLNILKTIFVNNRPEFEQKMNIRWLAPFFFMLNTQDKLSQLEKNEGLDELYSMQKDVLEDVYGNIEHAGRAGLDGLCNGDMSLVLDSSRFEELYIFLLFVYIQYFRTLNVKKIMSESLVAKSDFRNFKAVQPVLALMVASDISLTTILEIGEKRFCHILKNDTDIEFITSDQPVVFIKDYFSSGFSLYYPLSPKLALLINSTKDYSENVTGEIVNYYNFNMKCKADRHIIGAKMNTLENLKNVKK